GAGQTAFLGLLTGTGVDGTNNHGIWSEGGGAGLALVAREGDSAPGTPSGVNFRGFCCVRVLNGAGQTAFLGTLTGTGVTSSNDRGIWSEGGGAGLALVAREGDSAPGTPSGVNFRTFNIPNIPVLNGAGQTAFLGFLTGTGVDFTNDHGIWAEDLSGSLSLVARAGDLLDIDDGPGVDLRTISDLIFTADSGNEDGRANGFNDLGQLVFGATFTDGSQGVFVSDLVAVPEPGTFLLATLASLLGIGRRRRRVPPVGELKNIKRVAPTLGRKSHCYRNRHGRTSVGVPGTRS
ncbi:MAG: PEP-CTERM sorting domain-containing protein, partial [Planctomycetes bacterium]|nr:PEP-CTERM sorting domain-containing protein [Planctomycetota bacterium]